MNLPKTKKFIQEGIEMYKIINEGGLFTFETRDYKTVYDLEEAVNLNSNGWNFKNYEEFFGNLTLELYRDLRDKQD